MLNSIPWTEKYRPTTIEDIVLDPQIEKQIQIFLLDQKNIHLLITGFPGIGKTTTVKCIAKKILGENINSGYLELNAAEDRGGKIVSTVIPSFCKRVVNFTGSKIILLDEADNMTQRCQNDINNMIKKYGRNTKFIFTCNDSTKIIRDIQSVCRIIRFKCLTLQQVSSYLSKICKLENIPFDQLGLKTIYYISYGDMRKAINDLQKTAYTFNKVTKQTVLRICKVPDPEDIKTIINLCIQANLVDANNKMEYIIKEGYCYLDIVAAFVYVLTNYDDNDMNEDKKLRLIDIVNQTRILVSTGLRSKLQLSGMICRMIQATTNHKKN